MLSWTLQPGTSVGCFHSSSVRAAPSAAMRVHTSSRASTIAASSGLTAVIPSSFRNVDDGANAVIRQLLHDDVGVDAARLDVVAQVHEVDGLPHVLGDGVDLRRVEPGELRVERAGGRFRAQPVEALDVPALDHGLV